MLADERCCVRMLEEISQRIVHITHAVLDRRSAGGNCEAVQQRLRAEVVFLSPHLHRHGTVVVAPAVVAPSLTAEPQPREHARELCDLRVAVSRDWLVKPIELAHAALIQLPEADAKQLLHFPRVIFIWILVDLWARFLISDVTEVTTHHRMERHLAQNIGVIAKGIPHEDVVVIRNAERFVFQIRIAPRHDADLAQHKRHALPQLIRPGHCAARERRDAVIAKDEIIHLAEKIGEVGARAVEVRVNLFHVRPMQRRWLVRDLIVNPRRDA